MCDVAWIDEYCTKKPGVQRDYKPEWGAFRYMLCGKMFAMRGADKAGRPIFTMKLPPSMGFSLREQYPGIIVPGYYMNKEHWNSLYLDQKMPEEVVRGILDASYETLLRALSKKQQAQMLALDE